MPRKAGIEAVEIEERRLDDLGLPAQRVARIKFEAVETDGAPARLLRCPKRLCLQKNLEMPQRWRDHALDELFLRLPPSPHKTASLTRPRPPARLPPPRVCGIDNCE